jgi:Zn-dependent protease
MSKQGSSRGARGRPAAPGAPDAGALTLASPVGVSLVAIGSWWATAAVWGPFSRAADDWGQLLLSAVVVMLLSTCHELGHAVAGRLAGLHFRSLTVGPLTVVRRDGRWRIVPNAHWIRFAGCVEHDLTVGRTTREDFAVSVIGGPAANLVLATVIMIAGGGSTVARDLASWSCFFGLVNLLPLRLNGQTSDGGLLVRLMSSRPQDVEWRTRVFGRAH